MHVCLGPQSAAKQQLDRFCRICRAHQSAQQTDRHAQTTELVTCETIGRNYAMAIASTRQPAEIRETLGWQLTALREALLQSDVVVREDLCFDVDPALPMTSSAHLLDHRL